MNFRQLFSCIREEIAKNNVESIKKLLKEKNPVDISQLIRLLPSSKQGVVFRLLAKGKAIAVFEQLNVEDKETLVHSLQEENGIEYLTHLDPDDQAELLEELPAKVAKRLLALLSPEKRQAVNILLGYPEDTAGRIMTPHYVSLRNSLTVGEALDRIQTVGSDKETIYYCYVTDDKRIFKRSCVAQRFGFSKT